MWLKWSCKIQEDFRNRGRVAEGLVIECGKTGCVLRWESFLGIPSPQGEEENWLRFVRNDTVPLANGWFTIEQPGSIERPQDRDRVGSRSCPGEPFPRQYLTVVDRRDVMPEEVWATEPDGVLEQSPFGSHQPEVGSVPFPCVVIRA